jgi:polysaccharide pyruvyl transferase CsaB
VEDRDHRAEVLVASWLGSTNLGDELLFRALLRRLRPYADSVTAVSVDPDRTEEVHRVATVGHADVTGLVGAVGRADAMVFGGGGLVQDVTSPYNLPYHLGRVMLARTRRTPVVGVGLGVDPLRRRWSRAMVRRVWPSAAPMAVRDTRSRDETTDLGIDAVLAADLVLGLDPPTVGAADHVAVCLRPWHGGGRRRAAASWDRGFDPAMLSALASALDDLSGRTGLPIRFVAFQPDRDGPFHDAVAERLTSAEATAVLPTIDSVLDEVAGSRLVVSTRYHGAVAGLLAGRPVVGLSYSAKVAALADDAPGAVVAVEHTPEGVRALGSVGSGLLGEGRDVVGTRDRLRAREAGNGTVLESVLG